MSEDHWSSERGSAKVFRTPDRRNSSLRSSNTTGQAFGKPNRTLVPAPMVFRHKTLHLTAELTGKGNTNGNLQQ